MAKDPYEILGVKKDATEAQIKAAYRTRAKKHHPDLNPGNKDAEVAFKELNAANDLLSDPEKRAAFDRGEIDMDGQPQYQQHTYRDFADGPQGHRYNFSGDDFDLSDLESIFGGLGGRAGRGGMGGGFAGAGFGRPPVDAHYTIEVDFLEAARGAKKRVTMPDGKSLDITIPEGIEEGQKLRLRGQGSQPSGDAYVEVHIRQHPLFIRKGNDITVEVPMALQESVLGGKIQVPTIRGPVEMTLPRGTSTGAVLRLKGKGIKGGDQYVSLKLVMPREIDAELEEAIRKWAETHSYNPRKSVEAAL